jgi:putative ABC transport system substrate-binding protein
VKRREFITLLGGAAVAWPIAARTQQAAPPVIGFLNSGSESGRERLVAAFNKGLSETGYVGDRNTVIEYRWAEAQYDRFPALLADLVRRKVRVITAVAGTPPALAAKAATTTIPIVFVTAGDPVKLGLVASLNRPGGNVTGVSNLISELAPKRLGLLRELVPAATVIASLVNPDFQDAERQLSEVEAPARALGLQPIALRARSEREIDAAFATMAQHAPVMIAAVWVRILVLVTGWVAAAIIAFITGVLLSLPKLPVLVAGGDMWTCLLLLLSSSTAPVRRSGLP